MAANMELVNQRGISVGNVERINTIHAALVNLIDAYTLECDYDATFELIRQGEFALQELWGFSLDARYHTWVDRLNAHHLELKYAGRKFRCENTGDVEELKGPFHRGQLIGIGDGFIDISTHTMRVVGKIKELSPNA